MLAVSGGADSVALLRAMHRLKTSEDCVANKEPAHSRAQLRSLRPDFRQSPLLVAHFNHGLRGEASLADEQFVVDLADRLGIELRIGRPDDSAADDVSEDSLRSKRYRFLQQAAEQSGARYIVTAHTADDQVETILHRILRGTGLAGLAGIPRTRPLGDDAVLIRPMLEVTRRQVLDYLQSLNQPHREDVTNSTTDYTRNRIRHELLPLLARDYNPNVAAALLRLGQLAGDAQSIIDRRTDEWLDSRCKIASAAKAEFDCQRLSGDDRPLLREALTMIWKRQSWPLADMGFAEWDRLAALALGNSVQPMNFPGPVRAQKKGESLSLTRY